MILRRFREADLQELYEYLSDAETVQFEPYAPMNMEQAAEVLRQRMTSEEFIAVERKSDGRLLGNLYFAHREFGAMEIGYVFNRNFWGNGYARESCAAVIQKAFGEGTHRIYAECDPQNPASWRLLEALGFAREAHFRQNVRFWKDAAGEPIWKDTYLYALLNQK